MSLHCLRCGAESGWIEGNRRSDEPDMVNDLAMLIRRLCRKVPPDDKLRKQAEDYLKRKKL